MEGHQNIFYENYDLWFENLLFGKNEKDDFVEGDDEDSDFLDHSDASDNIFGTNEDPEWEPGQSDQEQVENDDMITESDADNATFDDPERSDDSVASENDMDVSDDDGPGVSTDEEQSDKQNSADELHVGCPESDQIDADDDPAGLSINNIIQGKRPRRQPERYADEVYQEEWYINEMLHDVGENELDYALYDENFEEDVETSDEEQEPSAGIEYDPDPINIF